jgi:hypothetical protein
MLDLGIMYHFHINPRDLSEEEYITLCIGVEKVVKELKG